MLCIEQRRRAFSFSTTRLVLADEPQLRFKQSTPPNVERAMRDQEHASDQRASGFLSLPAELRNTIYDKLLVHDTETFAETVRPPPLLFVCRLISHEYSGLFYSSSLFKVEAYHADTDSWCEIRCPSARRNILERSTFADLYDLWSLAKARRCCQKVCYNRESVQQGIVTVLTNAGFRRWRWSMET